MPFEIALLALSACFCGIAGTSYDIVADESTAWTTPASVSRCPLHKAFEINSVAGTGISLKPPGGGKFSVVHKELPAAARLDGSTGLIIRYSSPPGASGVSLWRIRVSSSANRRVRFTHLFSIPADGTTNETRYMPWTDFTGQIMQRTGILNCSKMQGDASCVLNPDNITHVSFLESEDTIAHEIMLHSVIVTTDPIQEQNAAQHHTEEAAALIWEREHHAMTVKEFDFNGTHYVMGGNCSGVCVMTPPPSPAVQSDDMAATTIAPAAPKLQGVAVSGASSAASHLFLVATSAVVSSALRAHL